MSPNKMERKTRLELATPTLARWCSTTELFPHDMKLEATPRIELGIKVLQTSRPYHLAMSPIKWSGKRGRTRDPTLARWCSTTELFPHEWRRMGLEPMTSAVTGRHSNQLNYRAVLLLCRCVSATCIIIRTMRHLVNTFSPSFSKKARAEENPPPRPLFHHSAESSFSSLRSLWTSLK